MAISFTDLLSGQGGFKTTGFNRDGARHYLDCSKTGEGRYVTPEWQGPNYLFSIGDWDFQYTILDYDAPEGTGHLGVYNWEQADFYTISSPVEVSILYYNAIVPFYSDGLYGLPIGSEHISSAKMNASLSLTGQKRTRVYTTSGLPDSQVDEDIEPDARLGLLGVQRNFDGSYTYAQLNQAALPDMTNDGNTRSVDITELIKTYITDIKPNHDAMAVWPILSGMTLTPGSTVGPEFMYHLFETCFTCNIVAGSPPASYAGTTVRYAYDWDIPILSLGSGGMTLNGFNTLAQARIDYRRAPAGTR